MSNDRAKGGSNVTLRDVARKAAVHPGTVSRALNVETRALVNEALCSWWILSGWDDRMD